MKTAILSWSVRVLAVLAWIGCESTPAPAPAPAPAPNQPAAAAATAPSGLPDLSHETSCTMMRWSTVTPTWERVAVQWDPASRTLRLPDAVRRFDDAMRVRDFGERGERLTYDGAGNLVLREAADAKAGRAYKYKNHYDAQRRLVRVESSRRRAGGEFSAFATDHAYHYDAQGLIDRVEVSIVPQDPAVSVRIERDQAGRIVKLTWGEPSAARQVDTLAYDDAGRLAAYSRDGLVVPKGIPADGTVEWVQTWQYDASGTPMRVDGVEGLDAEKVPHETTLWSGACRELGTLWPELYNPPYLPLPAAARPRLFGSP